MRVAGLAKPVIGRLISAKRRFVKSGGSGLKPFLRSATEYVSK